MRRVLLPLGVLGMLAAAAACSSGSNNSGFVDPDAGGGGPDAGNGADTGQVLPDDSGTFGGDGGVKPPPDGSVVVTTTIYAHSDDTLYSMDPQQKTVTLIGKFSGTSGGTNDKSITDLAVNGAGDVYVNSESVIYKAAVPASPGTVNLTKIASISLQTNQKFYALAFTPAGVLGSGETLIGGDGNGELWAIDTGSGATKSLGGFGKDPNTAGNVFGLSGDLVFYMDASNKPTGLATVRSCKSGTTTCSNTSDYLVAVDMTALAAAYTSGTPAASLLAGIYGGSGQNTGTGTGYGELYGLGAWQGDVYAFARAPKAGGSPRLVSIDTTTGKGTVVPSGSGFTFTNGWSGAGVTTKTVVTIPPPPPGPK